MAHLARSVIANMSRTDLLKAVIDNSIPAGERPAVKLARYSQWDDESLRNLLGRLEDAVALEGMYTNTQEETNLPTKQEAANDLAVTVASASKAKAASELATAIANLSALSTPGLDESRVRVIAKEVASNEFATLSKGPQAVTVQVGATKAMPALNAGLCHYLFPTLNFWVNGGFNVYLYGPAGSSKTTSAKQLADVRSAEFGHFSMELTATRSDLLGYMAADGTYVPKSKFRDIYTMGGVFFLDEYDSPSTLHVALNTAFANGVCAFPNGDGVKHPDTIIVAAGNTAMGGGNATYNGRQTVDGASVDRFVFLHWEEDWELVAAYNGINSVTPAPRIAAAVERTTPPDAKQAKEWGTQWGQWIHDANAYVKLSKGAIKTLVTPRAVNAGIYALVNSTLDIYDIADSVVFRWRDEAGKENILKNVPLPVLKGR